MARIVLVLLFIVVSIIAKAHFSSKPVANPGDNIILVAAPKSASESLAEGLTNKLGYRQRKISSGYVPYDQIQYLEIEEFFRHRHVICKQHTDASTLNVQYIKKYTDRVIVHVRDPREILLSWVHHLNRLYTAKAYFQFYKISPQPPEEYFCWDTSKQIDWSIENFLPGIVAWMQGWIEVAEREALSEDGLKILFTKFDDYKSEPDKFYSKVLQFYGIKQPKMLQKNKLDIPRINFRVGNSNEWRSVYNENQNEKIAAIIPTKLLEYFGW